MPLSEAAWGGDPELVAEVARLGVERLTSS